MISKVSFYLKLKENPFHIILSLLLIIFLGCSKTEENSQKEIRHPVTEFIPYHNQIKDLGYKEEIASQSLKKFLTAIRNAEEVASIGGTRSGAKIVTFGFIADLQTDSQNNIYILDRQIPALRKFDSEGTPVSVYVGKKGNKRTALFRPVDLLIGIDDLIYVSDVYGHVKVLVSPANEIEYKRSVSPALFPSDMCMLDDNIYMRNVAENKEQREKAIYSTVQVYSLKNEKYISSFGLLYKSPRPVTNRRMSGGGKIACIEATDTIIYSFKPFGYLFAYSTKGNLKWITKLPGFKGIEAIERLDSEGNLAGYSYSFKGNRGEIISIQPFYRKYFLVQVEQSRSKLDNYPTVIKSYVLSSKNGQGIYRTNSLPYIMEVNDKYFYAKNINSIPGIKVYRF